MDTWSYFLNAESVGAVLTSCLFSPPHSLHSHLWLWSPACLSSSLYPLYKMKVKKFNKRIQV